MVVMLEIQLMAMLSQFGLRIMFWEGIFTIVIFSSFMVVLFSSFGLFIYYQCYNKQYYHYCCRHFVITFLTDKIIINLFAYVASLRHYMWLILNLLYSVT